MGNYVPTYDGNGNLTYDGTFNYCYDTESRLIDVIQGGTCASPTNTIATYAYDAQGRRKSKTVSGATTIFVTDADNREVVEYDGSTGAVQNWYAYGLGPNEVLNQMNVAGATRATMIPDIQGSIIGTLDAASGALVKRGYRPYGESVSVTGSFAYTGQRIDPETGGLYYYRARMYAPGWGRFMQPDPIGYAGGNNLYAYVHNDPLNNVDPNGDCGPLCLAAALAAGGAAVGVATQFVVDIAVNGRLSSAGQYISAATSGASLGLSVVPGAGAVAGAALKFAGGAAAGAVGSALGQYYDTGTIETNKVLVDAAISGTASLFSGPAINGITAGRNSFLTIGETATTKLANGTIADLSASTVSRATIGKSTESVNGAFVGGFLDSSFGGAAITPAK